MSEDKYNYCCWGVCEIRTGMATIAVIVGCLSIYNFFMGILYITDKHWIGVPYIIQFFSINWLFSVIIAGLNKEDYNLEQIPKVFIMVIGLTVFLDIIIITWMASDYDYIDKDLI